MAAISMASSRLRLFSRNVAVVQRLASRSRWTTTVRAEPGGRSVATAFKALLAAAGTMKTRKTCDTTDASHCKSFTLIYMIVLVIVLDCTSKRCWGRIGLAQAGQKFMLERRCAIEMML